MPDEVDVIEESSDLTNAEPNEEPGETPDGLEDSAGTDETPPPADEDDEQEPEGLSPKASARFQRLANERNAMKAAIEAAGLEWNGTEFVEKQGVTPQEPTLEPPKQPEPPENGAEDEEPDDVQLARSAIGATLDEIIDWRAEKFGETWDTGQAADFKAAQREIVRNHEAELKDQKAQAAANNAREFAAYKRTEDWLKTSPLITQDADIAAQVKALIGNDLKSGVTYQQMVVPINDAGETPLDILALSLIGRRAIRGTAKAKTEAERVAGLTRQPGATTNNSAGGKVPSLTAEQRAYAQRYGMDPKVYAEELQRVREANK